MKLGPICNDGMIKTWETLTGGGVEEEYWKGKRVTARQVHLDGFTGDNKLKCEQNNDMTLNNNDIYLLNYFPLCSFGFASGIPAMAPYSSSILTQLS